MSRPSILSLSIEDSRCLVDHGATAVPTFLVGLGGHAGSGILFIDVPHLLMGLPLLTEKSSYQYKLSTSEGVTYEGTLVVIRCYEKQGRVSLYAASTNYKREG